MNYERIVRRLRQRIFIYEDESVAKGEKGTRVLRKALAKEADRTRPARERQERERQDRYMRLME